MIGRNGIASTLAALLPALVLSAVLALSQTTSWAADAAMVFEGDAAADGQSLTHSVAGTAGDMSAEIEASTDYGSSLLRLIVRAQDQRELVNVTLPASSTPARKKISFKVDANQPLEAQVMLGLDVGVRVKYSLTFARSGQLMGTPENRVKPLPQPLAVPSKEVVEASQSFGGASEAKLPIEDKWALVVGVSKFQKPGIDLKFSAKDATDFRDFLVKEAAFAPDHVKLLVDQDATKERVLAEIGDKWLPRLARPNDLVVIFISTHGSQSSLDVEGINYLVMHNTDPESLYATGLPLQDLAKAIRQRVHAKRVVLIVDACHSGAANPTKGLTRQPRNIDSAALSAGSGQLVICSSEPTEVSWESKRYLNSVFTRQLIEALRDKSGRSPLKDVFGKLKEAVTSEVLTDRKELQTPVLKSNWKGADLIITAPACAPRMVPTEVK